MHPRTHTHAHTRARIHKYTGAQALALCKTATPGKPPRCGRQTTAKTALWQAGCRPRGRCKLERSGLAVCLGRPSAAFRPSHCQPPKQVNSRACRHLTAGTTAQQLADVGCRRRRKCKFCALRPRRVAGAIKSGPTMGRKILEYLGKKSSVVNDCGTEGIWGKNGNTIRTPGKNFGCQYYCDRQTLANTSTWSKTTRGEL